MLGISARSHVDAATLRRALEPKPRKWNETDDPVNHCLAGNSLLLMGLLGTGTEAARAGQGGTHLGAQTAKAGCDHAADLACVGLNANVKFLLLGDFRQLPAVLDSGRPISVPLEHSQLIRDLACGRRHELMENMRSDPGIFNFVKSVGRAFEAAGWEVVSLDIVSKFELGLHDVSAGALRHGLGQPGLHGIQPHTDDAPGTAAADGGAVREGQPAVTRAAAQRSCCAVRQDCACGQSLPSG